MLPAASELAHRADQIFLGIVAVSAILLVGITGAMVYFVYRYRRDRNPVPSDIRSSLPLEVAWTVFPTILVLGMFYFGLIGFQDMRKVPPDAMRVKVTARMWSWAFTYEDGRTSNELYLPVGKAVRLDLHSEDVLHSFFVPAFRIKEDAVPGVDTYLWFLPERVGTYDVLCAEYCGLGHSAMLSRVVVQEQDAFQAWYRAPRTSEFVSGEDLLAAKGCTGCHSLDGSRRVGPSFLGIFGRNEVVMTGGAERNVVVDRAYLRQSILEPGIDVVQGYPAVMPPQGSLLSDRELELILDFLSEQASGAGENISGKEPEGEPAGERQEEPREPAVLPEKPQPPPGKAEEERDRPDGASLLTAKGCTACHSLDGSRLVGPTFRNISGRRETVITEGAEREIRIDREYLRRSLLEPGVDLVKGYPAVMPSQQGLLSEEEIVAIVDFLDGLKGEGQ